MLITKIDRYKKKPVFARPQGTTSQIIVIVVVVVRRRRHRRLASFLARGLRQVDAGLPILV